MSEGFGKLAEGVGKAIETVPDLYDDALKPATQELGKTLSLIPCAINAALVPLRQWIAEREYKLAETEKLLAQKLEHVDEDKIVTPEAYVAISAIQAISYSMNSEELRNLYANLLAKAMNSDTKDEVHPAYVNIISQMSPLDARVLKIVANTKDNDFPLIDIVACNKSMLEKPTIYLFQNLSSTNISNAESLSLSFENLHRNNLIHFVEKPYSDGYYSIYNSQEYLHVIESLKTKLSPELPHLDIKEKTGYLTQFGKMFCQICVFN